jgi:hypothetical protein
VLSSELSRSAPLLKICLSHKSSSSWSARFFLAFLSHKANLISRSLQGALERTILSICKCLQHESYVKHRPGPHKMQSVAKRKYSIGDSQLCYEPLWASWVILVPLTQLLYVLNIKLIKYLHNGEMFPRVNSLN